MKFLHFSDLHLGKRLNEFSLLEDQAYILEQIIKIVDEERPDAVLIAGDVYDKAVPSAEAVALFDRFLTQLARRPGKVFVSSGNHDSAERIAFGASIMGRSGVYVSPVYEGHVEPVTVSDRQGMEAAVYMLPFVKPATVRPFFPEREIASYTDAVRAAVEEMMGRNAAERSDTEQGGAGQDGAEQVGVGQASCCGVGKNFTGPRILLSHQFVTGALRSDSEEVSVGGVDNVDVSVFAPFNYVALGHLHAAQEIAIPRQEQTGGGQKEQFVERRQEQIGDGKQAPPAPQDASGEVSVSHGIARYCGAPLKYSFGEAGQEKSATIVEFAAGAGGSSASCTAPHIRTRPLRPLRDLLNVCGTYLEVTARDFYNGFDRNAYLHVTLTDEEDVPDAARKLALIYPNLMKLDYDNVRTRTHQEVDGAQEPERQDPLALFAAFYEKQNNQPMSAEQEKDVRALIGKVWDENS